MRVLSKTQTFECLLCDVSLTSQVDLRAHEEGKSHAAKLRKAAEDQQNEGAVVDEFNTKSSFECSVCSITMTCELDLRAHEEGKSHAARLKKSAETRHDGVEAVTQAVAELKVSSFNCSVCSISMTAEVDLRAHEAGKSHRAKLAKLNESGENKKEIINSKASQGPSTGSTVTFECVVCNKTMGGRADLEAHNAGKSHLAKLTSSKFTASSSTNLACALCNVVFTGIQSMEDHMKSKKHLKLWEASTD